MKPIKGVTVVKVFRVTLKCGHTTNLPFTTSAKLLKKVVKSFCENCKPDTCLMH